MYFFSDPCKAVLSECCMFFVFFAPPITHLPQFAQHHFNCNKSSSKLTALNDYFYNTHATFRPVSERRTFKWLIMFFKKMLLVDRALKVAKFRVNSTVLGFTAMQTHRWQWMLHVSCRISQSGTPYSYK